MSHLVIPFAGRSTVLEVYPTLVIKADGNSSATISVSLRARVSAVDFIDVDIAFDDVLEFRRTHAGAEHEDHPEHEGDAPEGLIEILHSAYIETMAARGGGRDYPGFRIRDHPESRVRHFRLRFDSWGRLDVIATEFCLRNRPFRE